MEKLKVLDLFSGIGGFSLGLERTCGFETVAFCEIEAFPRKVLAKHWPNVPCYDDVRTLTAERLAADGIRVDAICAGFPCQGISIAGKALGLSDPRSGLWGDTLRLVSELEPRIVLLENSAMLLARGIGDILGGLAAIRYDAEWHCIPAGNLGAPHERDRIWIVAYPNGERCGQYHRPPPSQFHRSSPGIPIILAMKAGRRLGNKSLRRFAEWMMGYADGWTSLDSCTLETP